MATFGLDTRLAMYAESTGEMPALLVTLDHPSLSSPVRVCTAGVSVTSRGNIFSPAPLDVSFASDERDVIVSTEIVLPALDPAIVTAVRQATDVEPTILLELVRFADPETLEGATETYILRDVSGEEFQLRGTLAYDDILEDVHSGRRFDPFTAPGQH